jgi:outer membrane protein TolC
MVKVSIRSISILLLTVGFAATASAEKIPLSPKDVAELLLQHGDKSKEIQLKAEQTKLALAQVLSGYDFVFGLESGYEISKVPNFLGTQPDTDQTYKTTATLNKPLSSGTLLGLEYTQISKNTSYPLTSAAFASLPAQQTEDYFGVSLQQSLLKNTFGKADRAKIRAAQNIYDSGQTSRNDDLQNLTLDGIRLYWKAYVAQEAFQDSLTSRDRYIKLVEAVRKKTSYGYNSPGELAQVQAELEARLQDVKSKSVDFLAAVSDLSTLLHLPPGSEIDFKVPQEVPKPPTKSEKKTEDLRPVRALKLSLDAAEDLYSVSNNGTLPDLAFVGKYYQYGLQQTASAAQSDMWGGSRPDLYVGLKLTYNFGSGLQSEDERNKRLGRELAQTVLARRTLELNDNLDKTARNIQSTFAIFESAKLQRSYREQAAQELSKSYTQGRTDINTLIISLNNYFDSEVKYIKALGDYQTALNEYAAARDELIPDHKMETRK